ncbi:MAG: hypothetical protein K8T20_14565, partial [Planctomycetes bacterium]|nr:hypothetical protein [Planctomycetota bacterium]
ALLKWPDAGIQQVIRLPDGASDFDGGPDMVIPGFRRAPHLHRGTRNFDQSSPQDIEEVAEFLLASEGRDLRLPITLSEKEPCVPELFSEIQGDPYA